VLEPGDGELAVAGSFDRFTGGGNGGGAVAALELDLGERVVIRGFVRSEGDGLGGKRKCLVKVALRPGGEPGGVVVIRGARGERLADLLVSAEALLKELLGGGGLAGRSSLGTNSAISRTSPGSVRSACSSSRTASSGLPSDSSERARTL
jgi:hypothetical protein